MCTGPKTRRRKRLRTRAALDAYGYRLKAAGHGENSTFYKCQITVSPVFNPLHGTPALNSTLQVSDGMARLAAASIALQGRPWGKGVWKKYQLYTFG